MGGLKRPEKRAYGGVARRRKKETTHDRIIDAGLRLFARSGFDATALRDIAALAGVTHAVIRLHFGTKEELWRRSVSHMFATFRTEVTETLPANAPLNDLLRRYVLYCARHPEHVRIMLHESMSDSDRLGWMVDTFIAPAHSRLRPLLEAAIAEGVLPNVSVVSLIYMMSSASQAIFALGEEAQRIYGVDVTNPKVIDMHVKAIVAVFGTGDDATAAARPRPKR